MENLIVGDLINVSFYCGLNNIYYADNSNNLYCCGNNEYGQLGLGNNDNVNIFTKVERSKYSLRII